MEQLLSGTHGEYAFRLVASVVLGGVIGFEREVRDKPAGFRTIILCTVLALAIGNEFAFAQADQVRRPQFPPKSARRIYTDQDLQVARRNIDRYPTARAIADREIKQAGEWLDWSDKELIELIPAAAVPRAFNVGTEGCPKCGRAIYEKAGSYPWVIRLDDPFHVRCPICDGRFPSNDFRAYYAGGMSDRSLLTGEHPDDGWGWLGPNGHRYWFVAYANHWNLYNHVIPGIRSLARAYLLTGDGRYAHPCAVMLHRIADVYPSMDYHTQSRYGQMQQALGARYEGKIVNLIWETNVLQMLAEAYDAVWETIDEDMQMQQMLGKSPEAIRAHVEANILEEGIDAVFQGRISGNYGMHQRALVYAALARDSGPADQWLGGILDRIDTQNIRRLGLNYALYNLIYRDGIPYETAPGYNFHWVRNITDVAVTLKKAGIDAYKNRRLKRLYDGPLELINIGRHTPSLGDSGSIHGGLVGQDAFTFQAAHRAYGDNRYARFLASFGKVGEQGFEDFETLFHEPVPGPQAPPAPQRSRLLDGYGMGILSNPRDDVSLSIYYGCRGGHGHYDRLHFDIFAHGLPLTPDQGYPDFMNAYVPGIYTWSTNTIAHNTVTVDASRQKGNVPGTVTLFADSPFARVIEVEAGGTYPEATRYGRCLIMVDTDEHNSYFVDLFTAAGGRQHDYSLHGPPGAFQMIGGRWSDPAPGTLAGEHVAVGELYDDPTKAAPGYSGSYAGYAGSGFQHLTQVETLLEPAQWAAQWSHDSDPRAGLRIRILAQPGQEIFHAQAQASPVKYKQMLHYLIDRRDATSEPSVFLSLLEPFRDEPVIQKVQLLPQPVSNADPSRWTLAVERNGGVTDVIGLASYCAEGPAESAEGIRGDPRVSVVTYATGTRQMRRGFLAGATRAEIDGVASETDLTIEGTVMAVDLESSTLQVRLIHPPDTVPIERISNSVAHFRSEVRQTAHPIERAEVHGEVLMLTTRDDLLVGRPHVTAIGPSSVAGDALFEFPQVYRGAYLADQAGTRFFLIDRASTAEIQLQSPLPADHPFRVGEDAWIADVAPGDHMRIHLAWWWQDGRKAAE